MKSYKKPRGSKNKSLCRVRSSYLKAPANHRYTTKYTTKNVEGVEHTAFNCSWCGSKK